MDTKSWLKEYISGFASYYFPQIFKFYVPASENIRVSSKAYQEYADEGRVTYKILIFFKLKA